MQNKRSWFHTTISSLKLFLRNRTLKPLNYTKRLWKGRFVLGCTRSPVVLLIARPQFILEHPSMPMGKVITQLILILTLIWSVLKPWDSILSYVTAVLAVYRTLMRTPLSWSVLTLVVRPHPSFDHCNRLPPAMLARFRSAALHLLPKIVRFRWAILLKIRQYPITN